MTFVHLHNHTEYSQYGQGNKHGGIMGSRELVERAAELGMPAVAVTDCGTMAAAVELRDACIAVEAELGKTVKPLFGCCLKLDLSGCIGRCEPFDLVLIAKTDSGYRNLLRLITESSACGGRVEIDMVRRYGEGLVGLSCGPRSVIEAVAANGADNDAGRWALLLSDCFEPGDFYIELQEHSAVPGGAIAQMELNRALARIAEEVGVGTAATNCVLYARKEDAFAYELMRCVWEDRRVTQKTREETRCGQLFMKGEREMREAFVEFPGACDRAAEIAEKCNVGFPAPNCNPELPDPPVPEGETAESWFCALCERGLMRRYCEGADSFSELAAARPDVVERYEAELRLVLENRHHPYLLIVAEYVGWARERGICVGPGRGPAAGSVVAYALGITGIDPIKFGILSDDFSGFGCGKMLDIDVDFEDGRRMEVADHIEEMYGVDHVARIARYDRRYLQLAVRDAARALGSSDSEVSRICGMLEIAPVRWNIDVALSSNREFEAAYRHESDVREIVDAARLIRGSILRGNLHACGLALSRGKLAERTALASSERFGAVTQLDAPSLAGIGIAKFDVMALSALRVLAESCRNVQASGASQLSPDDIPHDDELALALLRGELSYGAEGIDLLESPMAGSLLERVRPRTFSDIVAVVALCRPDSEVPYSVDEFVRMLMFENPKYYRMVVSRAVLAMRMAYMKAHYPVEFMTATLACSRR